MTVKGMAAITEITSVEEFTKRMKKCAGLKRALHSESPQDDMGLGQVMHNFKRFLNAFLAQCKLSTGLRTCLVERVWQTVVSALHSDLFCLASDLDSQVANKVAALQWVTPEQFGVPNSHLVFKPRLWDYAIKRLKLIRL